MKLRDGSDDSAPPRRRSLAELQRLQFLRLEAGDLGQTLAQSVEAHHLRLEVAEAQRHRVQMTLDDLLRLLRLLALVGEHDRLQPRMMHRGGVTQRDEVERRA